MHGETAGRSLLRLRRFDDVLFVGRREGSLLRLLVLLFGGLLLLLLLLLLLK